MVSDDDQWRSVSVTDGHRQWWSVTVSDLSCDHQWPVAFIVCQSMDGPTDRRTDGLTDRMVTDLHQ